MEFFHRLSVFKRLWVAIILSARVQRGSALSEDGQLIESKEAAETGKKALDLSVNLS